ncbi:ABC transporter substrate-binding protein [Desulfofundulus thermobenzoicus]|uniref:ABC transporter substrate-binding protein n=1 Tax=Desulfofundulus thermobenzoicus TaxID=29376 RepID=A0A6N7IW90_9FIRM|nr:ABC transporter substrate-binding protein [Desulfofundulus thermobenzoicus]HHW43346.1 ABC transporter substrate-binding protein [Desulfotomaculum sp.]
MRASRKLIPILVLALFSLAILVTGCGGQSSTSPGTPAAKGEKVIKIGFIAPLTGDVKTFGESAKNGFRMALEQAGYKAGDFKIEPVEVDDRNDATEAVNVATKLVTQDGVKAIVGSLTSVTTIPISKFANDNKIVLITGTATSPKVTVDEGKRKDYVFRACFIDPTQGTVAAKFALNDLKLKTAAILYDQGNDYTIGLANNFKDAFTAGGGQVVAMESYSKNDMDFSAVLTNIAQKKPDILYLPDYYQKVSVIAQQARGKGIKSVFIGGDGWDSTDLDYKTMEGGYFTNHYSPQDPRPEVKNWVEKYKQKYGQEPDAFATNTYDATNLLLNAIKTANSDDPTKIKEALQNTKGFSMVSGQDISFDQNGNPIKPVTILKIEGGKQKFVTAIK